MAVGGQPHETKCIYMNNTSSPMKQGCPKIFEFVGHQVTRVCDIGSQMNLARLFDQSAPTPMVTYACADEYSPPTNLTVQAVHSLSIPNAGGKSNISEAYSIDMFVRSFRATNVLCENEVKYWAESFFGPGSQYKMVDFICTVSGHRVGVSVTRAMAFPISRPELYTQESADRLLFKKVNGLIVSSECVTDDHSFEKSVLHIFCQTNRIADMILLAWKKYEQTQSQLGIGGGVLMVICSVSSAREIYTNHMKLVNAKARVPRHLAKQQKRCKQLAAFAA